MQRILVIGAGAMGCLFAARIAQSGAQVRLIDVDQARIALIAREGIRLTDDNGTRTVRLDAGNAADSAGPFDLILLFTKGMHSAAAMQSVAHLVPGGAYVLTLQNGLGNPETIAQTFPAARVLKGIAALPADLDGPNAVTSHGAGHVELGSMTPEGADAARAAAALLARAGFDAGYSDMIDIAIWEKVAFNAALNALAAVALAPNAGMDNAPGRRIIAAMVAETVATAHACGVMVDGARIAASIDFALVHHSGHQASMLQDRLASRASEIDFIDGAVCVRARQAGIATPVLATMTDLIRLIELTAPRPV